ncbi:MAG: hypothetical protein AAGH82_09465 [Pseudomonadota bacterium]
MKKLGLFLLFAGFFGWGALSFWLPAITGEEVARHKFEDDRWTGRLDLSSDQAPLNIILEVDHLVPTNIAAGNRLVNRYSLQLRAPDGLMIDQSGALTVEGGTQNRGARVTSSINMMQLDDIQTGTYTVLLFEDSEPVIDTFGFTAKALGKVAAEPPWAVPASLMAASLGLVLLLASQMINRGRRRTYGAPERSDIPSPEAAKPKVARRWGRQTRG